MEYFVNKGAKLKCPCGSEQPELEVVHIGDTVLLCGKLMANIADNKPAVNIKPFGQCSSMVNPAVAAATAANYGRLQKMPCVPITPFPWLNGKMNLIINGSPALLNTSKCACSWSIGRLIEVADPGQNSVYVGGPMNITINEPTLETRQTLGRGAMASSSQTLQSSSSETANEKILVREVRRASEAYSGQEAEVKKEDSLTLHFDGKLLLLKIVKKDEILRLSYKAVSGRPLKDGSFDYSKERQKIKDQGPIPEGEYRINPQEIQYTSDRNLVGKTIDILGGVTGAIGIPLGEFPGGTIAWGVGRVWIQPKQVVVGGVLRDNFSIHGGTESGSAGCIDLTSNDRKFFDELTKYRGNITKIPLTVKY